MDETKNKLIPYMIWVRSVILRPLFVQVAAHYAFGQFIRPVTLHLQFGAAAVAGTFVWAPSHTLDVTTVSTLGLVLATGGAIHYGLFALASERFRAGSVRTMQDISRLLGAVT